MHTYLQSIGFSRYDEMDLLQLLKEIQDNPGETVVLREDDENPLVIYKREIIYGYPLGVGIAISGHMINGQFERSFYYPYYEGNGYISTKESCKISRKSERASYYGCVDDNRIGFSLIFNLLNYAQLTMRKCIRFDRIEDKAICLTGLAVEGKILFPIHKSRKAQKTHDYFGERAKLIERACEGDEDAVEILTKHEKNLFMRANNEDLFTVIDSYLAPHGYESDQYEIMGDIEELVFEINEITNERICIMQINCNDMLFRVVVNTKTLYGEPKVGRRFKGKIWMQGTVELT